MTGFTVTERVVEPCVGCGTCVETLTRGWTICPGCWTGSRWIFEDDYVGDDERAHPKRQLGDAAELTKPERMWMLRHDTATSSRRQPSFTGRVHRAAQTYRQQADAVADALMDATVAAPPPKRQTLGERRSMDTPDPALAQIVATHDAIDRGLTRFGHLLDNCLLCGDPDVDPRGHNDADTVTIARLLDDDWTDLVDHLAGISATSPRAVAVAVEQARRAHRGGADRFVEWFAVVSPRAESDVLANLATTFERQASRMRGLADSLSQWVPGVRVRRCACGCGGHAPSGRRVTDACEVRMRRERKARQESA